MNRHERKRLRELAFYGARRYLGVDRLPAGVPAMLRAWVDAFEQYPAPTYLSFGEPDPIASGLARLLAPYRKPFQGL